ELERGQIDLALLVEHPNMHGALFEPLLEEEIVVALPQGHPLSGRGTIPMRKLREERFILCREGYHLRTLTLAVCREAGFTPRIAVSGTDVDTALRFVRSGLGVTLVPQIALDDSRAVVALSLREPTVTRTVGLAWNPHRYLSK